MSEKIAVVRHLVAAIAYRGEKVLRNAPADFANVRAGAGCRSAVENLAHLGDLFECASSFIAGNPAWNPKQPGTWAEEVERFYRTLEELDQALQGEIAERCSLERLIQGPIGDSLTHIGQLATLRRLAGAPVKGENYYLAAVEVGKVGAEQTPPKEEFD